MPVLSLRVSAELLGVSEDTLRRWAGVGRVPLAQTSAGHQGIEARELAGLAVALAPERVQSSQAGSARNRLPGIVTNIVRDTVMAQVELQCGPHRIVSLISREAADELGLEPGSVAVAGIKATNVTVSLPADFNESR
jgi:molybdopterin-binding protein